MDVKYLTVDVYLSKKKKNNWFLTSGFFTFSESPTLIYREQPWESGKCTMTTILSHTFITEVEAEIQLGSTVKNVKICWVWHREIKY